MSENVVASPEPSASASPPETQTSFLPPENEPAKSPIVESSTTEKIKRAGTKVFNAFGVRYKKGSGRPRLDGKPSHTDIPLDAPPVEQVAPVASPVVAQAGFDLALCKKVCGAVLKGIGGFFSGILRKKAQSAGYSAQEVQALAAEAAITQEEIDAFGELGGIALQQYAVNVQHLPLIGCGLIVAGIGARYAAAIGGLNAEIKEKAHEGKIVPMEERQ